MNKPLEEMPSLLDREITNSSEDAFGHRHYTKAIKNLIEKHKPPYTIGLLGPWGVGKSSIKEMYLEDLNDESYKDKNRKEKIYTITFNAWRYGGLDIKRALLRHVYISLGGKEDDLTGKLYNQTTESLTRKRSWREIAKDFLQAFIWYPAQLILILLAFVICFFILMLLVKDLMWTTIATTVFAVAATSIWKQISSYKAPLVPLYSTVTKVYPPSTNAEQYIDYLIAQLKKFKDENSKYERIVIFIDDLDRLTAEEMVSALDAVRVFMDIPKEYMPNGVGVIFVISCDEDKVANALANKKNGREIDTQEARKYLDRIFQFRLEIPPMPKRDMRSYAKSKILQIMPDFEKELEQCGCDLSGVIDRLIHIKVQNPRNAVQLVNAFAQSWWIAKQREWDGSGSTRPGGLLEGTVTGYPIVLAIINVLKIDYHFFYNDMIEEPNVLGDFKKVFIQNNNNEFASSKSRLLLQKYGDLEKCELKDAYKDLRQYLASTQGVKTPKTLQPFILLSQDSVSRAIGDNTRLYDALVSGDVNSFLDELNVNSTVNMLNSDHIGTIKDIIEEIYLDSTSRVGNAAFVLGKLCGMFGEGAESIISFIVSKIIEFGSLRWRLSINSISDLIELCSSDEKREIASVLIDDFIVFDGFIEFKTAEGETYSYEEMENNVNKVIPIVLKVYKEVGLAEAYENKLIRWLKERKVSVEGTEDFIEYIKLNEWYNEFKQVLFEPIGVSYAYESLKYIKNRGIYKLDGFVNDFKEIIEYMWERGEESRNIVCDLLNTSYEIADEDVIKLSSNSFIEKLPYLNQIQVNILAKSYIVRLQKEFQDKKWKLIDWAHLSHSILNLIDKYRNIDESTLINLGELSKTWSANAERAQLACKAMDIILIKNKETASTTLSVWIDGIYDRLDNVCIEWIGKNINKIPNKVQDTLFVKLNILFSPNLTYSKNQLDALNLVFDSIEEEYYKIPSIINYLNQVVNIICSYYTTTPYVLSVLPFISTKLKYVSKTEATRALNAVFINSGYTGNPEVFSKISEAMVGQWEVFGSNNSELETMHNNFVNHLNSYYSSASSFKVLESFYTLIRDKFSDNHRLGTVKNFLLNIWGYHKQQISELIVKYDIKLEPQQIAEMYKSVNINLQSDKDALLFAWKHLIQHIDSNSYRQVVTLLLSHPKGSKEDFGLSYWIGMNKELSSELVDLALSDSLNDEQKQRIAYQLMAFIDKLKFEDLKRFIYESIINVIEGTLTVILDNNSVITGVITEDNKRNFNDSLIMAMTLCHSITYKRKVLEWLIQQKDPGLLRRNKKILAENLNKETKDILSEYYPDSKTLEKI